MLRVRPRLRVVPVAARQILIVLVSLGKCCFQMRDNASATNGIGSRVDEEEEESVLTRDLQASNGASGHSLQFAPTATIFISVIKKSKQYSPRVFLLNSWEVL